MCRQSIPPISRNFKTLMSLASMKHSSTTSDPIPSFRFFTASSPSILRKPTVTSRGSQLRYIHLINNSACSDAGGSLTEVIQYLQSLGVGALFRIDVDVHTDLRRSDSFRWIQRTRALTSSHFIKTGQDSPLKMITATIACFEGTKWQCWSLSSLYSATRKLTDSTISVGKWSKWKKR
jgi:hypothetical protein